MWPKLLLVPTLSIVAIASLSCRSPISLAKLEAAQNNDGVMSQSIYYVGSSALHHYFEQDQWSSYFSWIGTQRPGHPVVFRINRSELKIPDDWIFDHADYDGVNDACRIRCRVHTLPRPHVERRSEPGSKRVSDTKYPPLTDDPASWENPAIKR